MGLARRNWAGNVVYSAAEYAEPADLEELQHLVAAAARVKAVGTGHSFNRIADTDGLLVSTRGLVRPAVVDEAAGTVRVSSATRYAELTAQLDAAGWALHNLGSLPHISIAGACATGTHGSGDGNRSLPNAVVGVEFVRADGELVRVGPDDPSFPGAVLSIGALGIVTELTLSIEPAYDVRQEVWLDAPLDQVAERLDDVLSAGYSVSVFTTFSGRDTVDAIWVKRRTDAPRPPLPEDWLGARPATAAQHPIPGGDPAATTPQLGSVGAWHSRLPHFRVEFTPSAGDELQSEFFVARTDGAAALEALAGLAGTVAPALQVFEMRSIAADDLWLSPCQGRDTVGLHFTWVSDADAVRPALSAVQEALDRFDPRPHWGKVFVDDGAGWAARHYPRLGDFRDLAARHDPERCFANDYLQRHVLGA